MALKHPGCGFNPHPGKYSHTTYSTPTGSCIHFLNHETNLWDSDGILDSFEAQHRYQGFKSLVSVSPSYRLPKHALHDLIRGFPVGHVARVGNYN